MEGNDSIQGKLSNSFNNFLNYYLVPGDSIENASKRVLLTTQLIFSFAIGSTSFLLFCFLRTRWSSMYSPRLRLRGIAPDPLPSSFFGWIGPLLRISEVEILDRVGLDAAVVLLSPIGIASYFFDDNDFKFDDDGHDDGDKPPDSKSFLVAYAIFTWVFSLATFYFSFYNYKEFTHVRHHYYLKRKDTIATRTVMVTGIPKNLQFDKKLADFFESLELGEIESAVIYRHVRKLRYAIGLRTEYLKNLEFAYVQWLGNPCLDPNYDPDELYKEFEKSLNSEQPLSINSDGFSEHPVFSKIKKKRPTMRTSLFGQKVDKINYYTNLFKQYDELVKRGRRGAYSSSSVGFVTFKSIVSAQIASQILIRPEPFTCYTSLAPEPPDSFLNSVLEIIHDPTGIANKLATTLPRVSSFFVNFTALQGIGIVPFHLLKLSDVILAWIMRVIYSRTPRDYAEASAPPFLNYGEELPQIILIFVIILVYSSIAPIILLFVYFHPYETAGLAWPKIFRRIIVGLYIYQLMMIGYFSLKKSYYLTLATIPLPFITSLFFYYVNQAYYRISTVISLQHLVETEKKSQSIARIDNDENLSNDQSSTGKDKRNVHSDVLEDDLYHAAPDYYTDYSQPPMSLTEGILNTGMRDYRNPSLVGSLPILWLPVKRSLKDKSNQNGTIGSRLGMDSDKKKDKFSDLDANNNINLSASTASHDIQHQKNIDSELRLNQIIEDQDPNNPNKIYHPHSDEPAVGSSSSPSSRDQDQTSSSSTPSQNSKSNRAIISFGELAGSNFGFDQNKKAD
ncbi:4352_t:CDS:2 [Entrophospora sp. SA101]|nr:4352_t:CDS:2 [Entrophospora sp. SA101]CAJ0842622.1 12633_t:CDS:2 [Entrophospora sp. SA101]